MNAIDDVRIRLDNGNLWTKGMMEDCFGRVCLIGAALKSHEYPSKFADMINVVADVIREQYPERLVLLGAGVIEDSLALADFNDHPLTTWHDVELVLGKAAVVMDEAALTRGEPGRNDRPVEATLA